MTSNFFNRKMSVLNYDHSFNLDLSEFSADDMLPDNSFVAATNTLTTEQTLLQDVECVNLQTINDSFRMVPFYNRPLAILTEQVKGLRGFNLTPNLTNNTRKNAVKLAKYTHHHLKELYNALLKLKNSAVNNNVKNTVSNQLTQIFVLTEVMFNIIKQLTNNSNATILNENVDFNNRNFCVEVTNSLKHADQSLKGVIKLNGAVYIANISNQLHIMGVVLNNILQTLNSLKSYC